MKELGLYLGCTIPTEQYGYEMSIRQIMPDFDIKLIDLENVSCCGTPLKSINLVMQMYLSARIIAICESRNLDIYTPVSYTHLRAHET